VKPEEIALLPFRASPKTLNERMDEAAMREYPPAPEGQEGRWFIENLQDCEWPENCCPTVSLPCEQCPYYRPKQW
jgi:hypothetical protein